MRGNQENGTRGQLKFMKETKKALTIPSVMAVMVTVGLLVCFAPLTVRLRHGGGKTTKQHDQTNTRKVRRY